MKHETFETFLSLHKISDTMNELEILFRQHTGEKLLSKEELSASGSNRRYFRLESKNTSLIGVAGTSKEENQAFITMAKHFRTKGIPVPEFLSQTPDGLFYIQEDIGNTLLFDFIAEGRKTGVFCEPEKKMLRKKRKIKRSFIITSSPAIIIAKNNDNFN